MSERFKLELLATAQRELEEIALVHLALVGLDSARGITERIYASLKKLQTYPNMGISCRDKQLASQGYRMLICGHYLCFYRLIADSIYVYHIVDGRADYPKLLKGLE